MSIRKQERDAVGGHLKTGIRSGDIVGDDQVQMFVRQLALGIFQQVLALGGKTDHAPGITAGDFPLATAAKISAVGSSFNCGTPLVF